MKCPKCHSDKFTTKTERVEGKLIKYRQCNSCGNQYHFEYKDMPR